MPAVERSLAHLSQNNSDGSATAGIRAVGLLLRPELLLQSVFRINEFTTDVGSVKVDA
jgi:hypothetical protein